MVNTSVWWCQNLQIAIQIAFRRNMVTWGLFWGWDGIISGRRDQIFDSCRGLVWSSSIPGTTEPGFSCPVTASFTTSILQEKCSGTLPRTRDIKRYLPASLGKGPWEEAAPPRTREPFGCAGRANTGIWERFPLKKLCSSSFLIIGWTQIHQ